jgi:hypothetical protein
MDFLDTHAKNWTPLTPDPETANELIVYRRDYLGHHIADGVCNDGEYDKARGLGAHHIILKPGEMMTLRRIVAEDEQE